MRPPYRGLVLLLLPLLACSTSEGVTDQFYTGAYDYTAVVIVPGLLAPGDTGRAHLMAMARPGLVLGELDARWTGDDAGVASVDSTGFVTVHTTGSVDLVTDLDAYPTEARLYVSPDTACGIALDISEWTAQGGFTWNGAASTGDTAIAAHHTVSWMLVTGPPRQVNSDAVSWPILRPASAAEFSFARRDTLTAGTWKWVDVGNATYADSIPWWGEVQLLIPTCTMTVDVYPWTHDVLTLIRPSFADTVVEDDRFPGPFSSAEVPVGAITSGATIAIGGKIPLTLPTDADQPFGYGPTGHSAYVAVIHGDGVDSLTLVQDLTPHFEVPALTHRP